MKKMIILLISLFLLISACQQATKEPAQPLLNNEVSESADSVEKELNEVLAIDAELEIEEFDELAKDLQDLEQLE